MHKNYGELCLVNDSNLCQSNSPIDNNYTFWKNIKHCLNILGSNYKAETYTQTALERTELQQAMLT